MPRTPPWAKPQLLHRGHELQRLVVDRAVDEYDWQPLSWPDVPKAPPTLPSTARSGLRVMTMIPFLPPSPGARA